MSGFRFATTSEGSGPRWGACVLASLALHGGLLWSLGRLHPEHPFPATIEPIAVSLLREPAAVVPEPAPAAPTRIARPPTRPPSPRKPAQPPPPPRAKTAESTPQPEARERSPEPGPPNPAAPRNRLAPEVPARNAVLRIPEGPAGNPQDFARVFREHEVDRIAAPGSAIQPRYPERERRRGREGIVVLKLTVAADGVVAKVEVIESAGTAFDEAAIRALRRVRFTPALVAGRPVSSERRYRLRFALR